MDWLNAALELGVESLRLINRELAEKWQQKKMKLTKELAEEHAKPIVESHDFRYDLRDQAKIDKIEQELWLMKDMVLNEIKRNQKDGD
jgi:vacuolar-type H+-ATPase subunit I/STV1